MQHLLGQSLNYPNHSPMQEYCQAVVFQAGEHWFALPVSAVVRIAHTTAIASSHLSPHTTAASKNISQLQATAPSTTIFEGEPLYWIRLGYLLSNSIHQLEPSGMSTIDKSSFAIVTRTRANHLYGITLKNLPQVIQLPLSNICLLPPFYCDRIAHVASHAVIMSDHPIYPLIFLLDLHALDRLINGSPHLLEPNQS
jgi:hypothetical protein